LGFIGAILGFFGVIWAISYYSQDLPDYKQLKDYKPAIVTRIIADNGSLVADYAREKRIFVPIEFMPQRVKYAFISAEDKTFYSHNGLDYLGILSAALINVKNYGQNRSLVGASTITQQIAKNFLLTNEQKLERKMREALLALKIERVFTKEQLLELYLNEIFLGAGAYGVGAASQEYFDKTLQELDIHEAAFLAALPKAPSYLQPNKNYDAVFARRNWVIDQMHSNGYITEAEADLAKRQPIVVNDVQAPLQSNASYYAEDVRRLLEKDYGEEGLYYSGMLVKTSLDPDMQEAAVKALRNGLFYYERRKGYPGRVAILDSMNNWKGSLVKFKRQAGMPLYWQYAVVLDSTGKVGLPDGSTEKLNNEDWVWAKGSIPPRSVIMVEKKATKQADGAMKTEHHLRWVPKVQGGIVAMNPHTGRIMAMQGGWSTELSSFNRVSQAKRQPGSAFKPFVYISALEKDFTPATLVLDAPFVIDQGPGLKKWRPQNYSKEFYGPTPLRVGLEKSRNLMTVRLADYVGMEKIADTAERYGVMKDMPTFLSYALGAGETTLLDMTAGYAVFVNGGKKIQPTLIDRIQDRSGKTIMRHDTRPCAKCGERVAWSPLLEVPEIPDTREQLTDPMHAYQIVSMLEGVTKRGTAVSVGNELSFPVAGKTGTTNESKDAWFIGFTPDLVVGVYIGYDDPKPLGGHETGSSVAAPVFTEFMKEAMKDYEPIPFRVPEGISLVQIDANDGTRAEVGDQRVIWEAFLPGQEPTNNVYILDGKGISLLPSTGFEENSDGLLIDKGQSTLTGTGGIY
jgi:penicillin-binding protein 1A